MRIFLLILSCFTLFCFIKCLGSDKDGLRETITLNMAATFKAALYEAIQLSESYWLIISKYSGKCLYAPCYDNGCGLMQWDCSSPYNAFKWRMNVNSDGTVSIFNAQWQRGVDLDNGSWDDGA
jgi:hypothetical protein